MLLFACLFVCLFVCFLVLIFTLITVVGAKKFGMLNTLSIFVILGIGADDIFLMVTNNNKQPQQTPTFAITQTNNNNNNNNNNKTGRRVQTIEIGGQSRLPVAASSAGVDVGTCVESDADHFAHYCMLCLLFVCLFVCLFVVVVVVVFFNGWVV
jgi:hypothetical protein